MRPCIPPPPDPELQNEPEPTKLFTSFDPVTCTVSIGVSQGDEDIACVDLSPEQAADWARRLLRTLNAL